jgi:hypothetical protein
MYRRLLISPALLAAPLLLGRPAPALSQAPVTGAFVATLGKDTVAVERYKLASGRLSGASVTAYPAATLRTYLASFDADGRIQRLHIAMGKPGAEPSITADYVYGPDSVRAEIHRDTLVRRYAVATGGERPPPYFEDLFAFWEIAVRRAMRGEADSTTFGALAGRRILPMSFRRLGPAAADFGWDEWGTAHAVLDADGRFRRVDMTGTTTKFVVRRVPTVDVQQVASAWATRQQPGALSPRDTARAEIGPATVIVDYGRPSMRGRKVFGGIVPFGEVWRTGANAATQLITDRDLVIDGKDVPAGTYSLWTLPTASGWTLIINEQHGQWGTEYDPERDLVRVPMTVTRSDQPIERFTITVVGGEAGEGSIAFAWERTRATVVVEVKTDRSP